MQDRPGSPSDRPADEPSPAARADSSPESTLLVRRWRNGDPAALAELLERVEPGLRAYARLNMGPLLRAREGASDIVQSSLRRVLERLPALDFATEVEFRAYLCRSALHLILERRRYHDADRRSPRREAGVVDTLPEAVLCAYRSIASPSRAAITSEEVERFESAFDQLEPEQREVLTLRRVVGLRLSQVADQLGLEYGAARRLLGKATARLSMLLGEPLE